MGSPLKIIHCGEKRGSGLAAKLVNNLILGVQQAVVGEGMLVGVRMGVDPKVLVDVVGCSTGGCWAVGRNNPVRGALVGSGAGAVEGGGNEATGTTGAVEAPCERDYEGGFALELMLKVSLIFFLRFLCILIPISPTFLITYYPLEYHLLILYFLFHPFLVSLYILYTTYTIPCFTLLA